MLKCTFSPHIAIQVKDQPKAVKFLQDILGFRTIVEKKNETEMSLSDTRFYVEDNPALKTFFEFSTNDLSAMTEKLHQAGCKLKEVQIPEGDKSYLVYTPYGFNFHIWELREKPDPVDSVIYLSAELNCSAEKAFSYFTKPELITKWLTKKALIEARVGGKYELYWTPEDPDPENNSTYGCRILAINKPHFLHFNWKGNAEQKHFMNFTEPLTQVSVVFTETSKENCRINLIHSGWRPGSEWENARKYFISAWTGALKQLEKIVIKA
jgi:uncharacterized protein YndB with AHSA1/START domain/catechol 2,3-dioxygenase-like lactoylglutathione lyase family enzyme